MLNNDTLRELIQKEPSVKLPGSPGSVRAYHNVPCDPVDTTDVAMPCVYLHRPDDETRWDGSEWKKGGGHVQ